METMKKVLKLYPDYEEEIHDYYLEFCPPWNSVMTCFEMVCVLEKLLGSKRYTCPYLAENIEGNLKYWRRKCELHYGLY